MAVEGTRFQWWRNAVTISLNLEPIWEISAQIYGRCGVAMRLTILEKGFDWRGTRYAIEAVDLHIVAYLKMR